MSESLSHLAYHYCLCIESLSARAYLDRNDKKRIKGGQGSLNISKGPVKDMMMSWYPNVKRNAESEQISCYGSDIRSLVLKGF